MANETLTPTNMTACINKWVPYYNKAFNLGIVGGSGEDGVNYVTQRVGSSMSGSGDFAAWCTSEHNHHYQTYYLLLFELHN